MISILMLNIDRYAETVRTIAHNLPRIGYPYELLVCDNGSTDHRLFDFIQCLQPSYYRKNSKNEGIAKGLNQLYLRSRGSVIATMGNDILYPDNWGQIAVAWLNKVVNPGIASFDWGHGSAPSLSYKNGHQAHWATLEKSRIFGPCLVKRSVIETIGFFHDDYGPYGLEDSDFNERVNLAGYHSFYIPGLKCEHTGTGPLDEGDYRRMKDESLLANSKIFDERCLHFHTQGIIEPLPPARDPL